MYRATASLVSMSRQAGASARQTTTIVERNLCSPNLTKRGLTVAKNLAKQIVNANDTTENGRRSVMVVRKISTDAMNALCRRKADTTSGAGVASLKGNPRMISTTEVMEMVVDLSADVEHNCDVLISRSMENVGKGGFLITEAGAVKPREPRENRNANLLDLAILGLRQGTVPLIKWIFFLEMHHMI